MDEEEQIKKYLQLTNAMHAPDEYGQHIVTLRQARELLEKTGDLQPRSEPNSLQDELSGVNIMFTDATNAGDLIYGLQGSRPGKPPNLVELYSSPGCDGTGFLWTYLFGLPSAVKHGYNICKGKGFSVSGSKEFEKQLETNKKTYSELVSKAEEDGRGSNYRMRTLLPAIMPPQYQGGGSYQSRPQHRPQARHQHPRSGPQPNQSDDLEL